MNKTIVYPDDYSKTTNYDMEVCIYCMTKSQETKKICTALGQEIIKDLRKEKTLKKTIIYDKIVTSINNRIRQEAHISILYRFISANKNYKTGLQMVLSDSGIIKVGFESWGGSFWKKELRLSDPDLTEELTSYVIRILNRAKNERIKSRGRL
jgi:hypothetical protein